MVVKKDGSRERFERQKLIAGLLKACEKRPVSVAALEAIADRVEMTLQDRPEKEMSVADVGAFVMHELKGLDKVAYVRFASVYRHFRDVGEFMTELRDLLGAKECPSRASLGSQVWCSAWPAASRLPAARSGRPCPPRLPPRRSRPSPRRPTPTMTPSSR